MNDDRFFEQLRAGAQPLRYEPPEGDPLWTRLPARVRAATARQATVADVLVAWLRPLGASLAAIVLAATIGFSWSSDSATTNDLAATGGFDVSIAGDQYRVGQ